MEEEILDVNSGKVQENVVDKYLPIGSVVLLRGGKKRVMITGYFIGTSDSNKVYDYGGCYYPEGNLDSNGAFIFDHEKIDKIYHVGYIDDESIKFRDMLNGIDKNHLNS